MIKEYVKDGLIKILKDKEPLLFIENDCSLSNAVGNLEKFCVEHKIKYHTIFRVSKLNKKEFIDILNMHDAIIWESTYTSKKTHEIIDLLLSDEVSDYACGYNQKVLLLECYGYEPFWWYKPKTNKNVYILNSYNKDINNWEFYELNNDDKPIWDKKDNEI
jgi:ribosomal protein L7Ae-like RNA K-turn-binding protein